MAERAVLLCNERLIQPVHLPEHLRRVRRVPVVVEGEPLASLESMEQEHIRRVLGSCSGNRSQSAEILGIHRTTLLKKIKRYNLG